MNIHDELNWRGLLHQETANAKTFCQSPISVYAGFDPTAESLHVGNLIPLLTLKRFADAGHQVIALLGGATALIGDPSGRSTERTLSSIEEVQARGEKIASQLQHFLPNALIVNNYDWIQPIDLIGFLRDIGKHFSVNEMLHRDSVTSRLEQGISFTEFSYMLLQAYDFYHLAKKHGCLLQIGGSDQWGNIISGIDLIKKKINVDAHGITLPLITASNGQKLGKTADGAVWLDHNKTTPYKFYQYWLNTSDQDAIRFLKLFTNLDQREIADLAAAPPELRSAQKELAEELTTLVHGVTASLAIKIANKAIFDNEDLNKLNIDSWKILTESLPSKKYSTKVSIIQALLDTGLVKSKSEANREISAGGIYLNKNRISDPKIMVGPEFADFSLLRRGKKTYACLEFDSTEA